MNYLTARFLTAFALLTLGLFGCEDLVRNEVEPTRPRSASLPSVAPSASETEPTPAPSAPAPVALPAGQPIQVVSWNLQWLPGKKLRAEEAAQAAHMEEVQATLKEIDPDILLLQEVRDMESVEQAVGVLEGYKVHIVSRFKYRDQIGDQQVAIASRYPADSAFAEEWAPAAASPPRGFSFTAIELPGRILLTYCVHLKNNAGPERESALRIRLGFVVASRGILSDPLEVARISDDDAPLFYLVETFRSKGSVRFQQP